MLNTLLYDIGRDCFWKMNIAKKILLPIEIFVGKYGIFVFSIC